MVFSELYSAYYNALAEIIKQAQREPLTAAKAREIIGNTAFRESAVDHPLHRPHDRNPAVGRRKERVHVEDPYSFELVLGDVDTIPKNATVPVSEFDDEGNAIKRHSAKLGWVGRSYGFLDYGVEGGFNFRSKEG